MGKLNLNSVRASAKAVKADKGKGGGKFFRTVEGKNVLRLFTYDSGIVKDEDGEPVTRLERAIRKHYGVDGVKVQKCERTLAPDGRAHTECEVCTRVQEIADEEGEEKVKRLRSNKKFVINLVPIIVGDEALTGEPKMTTWEAPTTVIESILAVLEDAEDPSIYFGLNGRDLMVKYDPNADPKSQYVATFRDAEPSAKTSAVLKKYGPALLKGVLDLDSAADLNPDWYIAEMKKGGKKAAPAAAKPAAEATSDDDAQPPADDADAPAFDADAASADPADAPAGDDADSTPAEPTDDADAPAEPEAEPADPVWEGDALEPGMEAYWSSDKEKFFFSTPDGKSTFNEEKAREMYRAVAAKKKPAGKPAAAAPAAKPAAVAAKPVAGKPVAGKPAAAPAAKPAAGKARR